MPTTWYPYDNGTVGATGPEGPQGPAGAPGTPGVVQSINGKSTKDVTLAASDVNALPSNLNAQLEATYLSINKPAGNYRALRWLTDNTSRWEAQVDDVAETGSNAGSDFRLAARNDDGSYSRTVIHAKRSDGTISFGLTTHHGSAQVTSNGSVGIRDVTTDPEKTSGGVFLYSKGGVPFFKNADGTSFQVRPLTYPVSSVNGQTGNVTLGASDVGALSATSGGAAGGTIRVTGAAETYRTFGLSTGPTGSASDRWYFQADNTAEPGNGSGSNLVITARSDSGDFQKHVMYSKRDTGQTAFGVTVPLGDAQVTSNAAVGVRDQAADPATASGGVLLYSKAGKPYIKQGDGTVFQVGAGGFGGGGGAVDSVNGKTGIVTLAASDVNALPIAGGTLTGTTVIQPSSGYSLTAYGSTDPATSFRVTPEGHPYSNSLRATFYNLGIGDTTAPFGDGKFVLGVKNAATVPTTNPTNGAVVYSEGGVLKVRQTNGTVVTVANAPVTSVNGQTGNVDVSIESLEGVSVSNLGAASGVATLDSSKKMPVAQLPDLAVPSSFTPESLGMKAWAADPSFCASGFDYPGVGKGRMVAVYINRTVSVSKIVWHVFGYAGGLKAGSWAGIYNTSGALQRATGDMSTATYEPGQQHDLGGGMSTSKLTSAISLAPGVYYILWRFNYTASPVDGPGLGRFDSSAVCQSLMGVSNNIWRHASFTSSAASAPSSFTVSGFERDSIRFWAGLA